MRKMLKIIVLLITVIQVASATKLNSNQIRVLKTAIKVARPAHLEKILPAILLTETSAGAVLIGDNYDVYHKEKPFLLKSLGVGQVKLETAILMIRRYPKYFNKYSRSLIHKDPMSFKKYIPLQKNITKFKDIIYRWEKRVHNTKQKRVLKWARKELKYNQNKFRKYKKYYIKDLKLAQKLLANNYFNNIVSILYLRYNYRIAKSRGYKNPLWKAISSYNGGWYNKKYIHRVKKNMILMRKLKRKYNL